MHEADQPYIQSKLYCAPCTFVCVVISCQAQRYATSLLTVRTYIDIVLPSSSMDDGSHISSYPVIYATRRRKKSDHIVLFYSTNVSRTSHTRNIKIKTAQSSAKAADLSTCPYGAVVKFRLKFLDPDPDPDPHHNRTVCH